MIIKVISLSIIVNTVILGSFAYYFANDFKQTGLYFLYCIITIFVIVPMYKGFIANLAFEIFGKTKMVIFFEQVITENEFPKYQDYLSGEMWLDKIIKDDSLNFSMRLAASEFQMILSTIIGKSSMSDAQNKVVDALTTAIEKVKKN